MKVSYAPLYKVIKVESVMASLWELGPVIIGPTEDFVSSLQNKGLLASSRTCSSCSGAVMRLGKRGDVMVVYGDVPSARLLRVSVREVFFYKVQDASEEVAVTPSLLGAPVACKGCL